jgi:CheY-like chemotaxis protein
MSAKRILIAEDDEDDQELFYYFLGKRKDIDLMSIVENGVELIKTLQNITNKEELPDFIILDQNMPKQNGLQTLKILKGEGGYADIPVMVYSTYIDQNLLDSCMNSGASALMTKPITEEGYNKMIDSFLEYV